MNESKITINGEITHNEKYDVGLLEVIGIPDEININNGKAAIHATHSCDLRNFCRQNRLPLFVCRARTNMPTDKEYRFTRFNGLWIFAYKDEDESD